MTMRIVTSVNEMFVVTALKVQFNRKFTASFAFESLSSIHMPLRRFYC